MTLDQIRYFCTIAQLGSFSRAAEVLHIAQPSLSISMRRLEQEYDVRLFEPNRKGAVLTDAGRLFLQDAQQILLQADAAATHLRQVAQRSRAEIRLAYTSSLADAFIPEVLGEFARAEGRDCCIYSDEMPSDQIAQGVREGRFDFGLGSQLPADPEVEQVPIEYQKLCLLVPPQDGGDYEELSEFAAAPLICYRRDYPMYRLLSELFDRLALSPHIIHYAYGEAAIARLVAQGVGIGVVARIRGLEGYPVRILQPAWLTGGRTIFLIRHRTRPMTLAASQLQQRILSKRQQF